MVHRENIRAFAGSPYILNLRILEPMDSRDRINEEEAQVLEGGDDEYQLFCN